MTRTAHTHRRAASALLGAVLAGLILFPAATGAREHAGRWTAAASGPDRPFETPVARGSATARTSISAGGLRRALKRALRRAGGRSGAWVMDAASGRVLFASGAGRRLPLASNTKAFVTATAIGRFGPEERLRTAVWAGDDHDDGVVGKGLFLRGGGDPTLSTRDLRKLAGRVAAAGVERVKGPLFYDDSFLDRRDGVPQRGISPERVGTLSALTLDGGWARAPERLAALRLSDALRRAGVKISKKVRRRGTPPKAGGAVRVALVASPTIGDLARLTNTPSNNFLAEMMLKVVAGEFAGRGSTGAGIKVVKRFAARRGSAFHGENGSGLSRVDRASPSSVGALLRGMLADDTGAERRAREAFIQSLAVAGRSGTLASRMRGSAAAGRCAAKTGTLTGTSALSGYCFRANGEATVFSILNDRVNTDRARAAQDRMAALIARYSP
jgi:D-alanyl-D-alanine carboxypeptidase/D-alanyl-D-alanine-endopeptidase (penicillin-binding protein 4)